MKVIVFGTARIFILFTAIAFGQINQRGLEYKRETLFETKPWAAPYYLPLQYGQNNYHFEHKQTGRLTVRESKQDTAFSPMAPTVDYFWALNSGNLVFIDKNQGIMKSGKISVLDYRNQRWMDHLICEDYHDYFCNIWTGPNDEVYFNYYSLKKPANSDGSRFRLKKYFLEKSGWDHEPDYSPIVLVGPSALLDIAPSGKIFIHDDDAISDTGKASGRIFSPAGKFETTTAADVETMYGFFFNFNRGESSDNAIKSIIEIDRSGLLQEKFGGLARKDFNFKATFDSLIIIYSNHSIDRHSEDGKFFLINLPSIVVFNPRGGQALEIDLADSINSNYDYYNVSDIAVNFKGEIYALFVYFDNPYRITGDEMIVLYRWTREK